jgi:uncharacterized protein
LKRAKCCAKVLTVLSLGFAFLPNPMVRGQAPAAEARSQGRPNTLEGDWAGTLQVGESFLHLVLHVAKVPDGSIKATIDSLDQGVYDIEVTSLTQNDLALHLNVSSVNASFEGKIAPDYQSVDGTWSQGGGILPLVFHRRKLGVGAKKPVDAVAEAEGTWQGALETTGMRLRLQLHVSHDDQKQLVAVMDILEQEIHGLPTIKVTQTNSAFHFEIPSVGGTYDGTLDAARNALAGSWVQNGVAQKLDFQRSDRALEVRRPQNPPKPYPYKEEDVTFPNAKANISLSGTLTFPHGQGSFPAAVLLSGSGPQDRDESLAGHRPFLILADHLTRKGIAVLRFDKRGVGKSTGTYAEANTEDFASDAEAAIAFLKTRREIDPTRLGLIGHSEGGLIAPMIAARSREVAWVVLLAGPALKGENTLLLQSELISRIGGLNDTQISKSLDFDKHAYALVRQEKNRAALEAKLNDLVQSSGMNAAMPPAALQAQIHLISSPWFRYFLDYDPLPALQKTKCPVLALNGQKDLQVPPKENLPLIRKALENGGNKDSQTVEMPGLNHLFQHCQNGSPGEYGAIEETFAPEALSLVSGWVRKHTAP